MVPIVLDLILPTKGGPGMKLQFRKAEYRISNKEFRSKNFISDFVIVQPPRHKGTRKGYV